MSKAPNLKEIERRTYLSYHQDGLLDILIGVYILGLGLAYIMYFVWGFDRQFVTLTPILLSGIIMPIWLVTKRKLTMPRIGYVNFGKKGRNKIIAFYLVLMAAVLCTFFTLLFICSPRYGDPLWRDLISQNILLIIGVGSLVVFVAFGYTVGLKRLYGYGLLTLTVFAAGQFFGIFIGYLIMALGTIVLLKGVALLITFLKKYPLQGGKAIAD